MTNPSVQFNQKQAEPSMKDLLDLHKKDIFLSFNCHGIATVQSFNSTAQTVTATMNYKKSFLQANAQGIYETRLVDYPLMLDMPVVILSGGPANLTFPIQEGDTCLVLFNDRDIDNWFQSGQIGPVASGRLHSFSDGIALVGLRSSATAIDPFDDTRAGLAWGDTMVKVSEQKVKIANTLYTMNTLLQELVVGINSLVAQTAAITVTCSAPTLPSSPPINAAAIAAVATTLSATAVKIGELLE